MSKRFSARNASAMLLVTLTWLGPISTVRAQDDATPPVDEYRIGVEDKLAISVWREPEVSLSISVRPDGKITVPLVGDVQAAGRTASEITDQLSEALSTYIKEPVVTVIVTEVNSFKVFVIGEVNRQGEQRLRKKTRGSSGEVPPRMSSVRMARGVGVPSSS